MESFWRESFWLPENVTWKELEIPKDGSLYMGNPRDLVYVIPVTLFLLVLRFILENYVFFYIALYFNIPYEVRRSAPEPLFEEQFRKNSRPDQKTLGALAKKRECSVRYVERWFRKETRRSKRVTPMTKFQETSWRFLYYGASLAFGLVVLHNKSWTWDTIQCWKGYPRQHVTEDVFWYYTLSTSMYVALFISQFKDIKRKDFWEMFVHHVATIILLAGSFSANLIRVGTLVVCIHDISDVLLEFGKLLKYAGKQFLCNVVFVLFTLSWVATRLIGFPFWVIYSAAFECKDVIGLWPAQVMLNVFLVLLAILHCIWFVMILNALHTAIMSGNVQKDVRSSDEESSEADDDSPNGGADPKPTNGHTRPNLAQKKSK